MAGIFEQPDHPLLPGAVSVARRRRASHFGVACRRNPFALDRRVNHVFRLTES